MSYDDLQRRCQVFSGKRLLLSGLSSSTCCDRCMAGTARILLAELRYSIADNDRSVDLVKQNALVALPQAADNAPGRL
jgi:hypothetical protein